MTAATTTRRDYGRAPAAVASAIVAVGLVGAVTVALMVGATASEVLVLVGMAAGGSALVAAASTMLLRALRRRGLATQVFGVALASIAATAAGVGVAAWAMFLSAHDLGVLAVVLLLSAAVAAAAAWLLGAAFRASAAAVSDQVSLLDSDTPVGPRDDLVTGELQALSRAVAEAHRELLDARARTRRLESSRRELVAWVSHDLRSPIGAIRAMSEALEDGVVVDPVDVADYHRGIRQETERLAQLVDDLFELARIEAGAIAVDVPFVPVHELVPEVVDAARVRAEAAGVVLVAELDGFGSELVVAADLRRALDNVLDNAIRHTGAGGTVTVSVVDARGRAVLVVADECGGIPDDELDRVFEAAYRGDTSRTRGTGGGGLGLAIAKGLVEARAGEISVRNRAGGCEFTISMGHPTGS
ncbi:MAG: HAMP domain-containing sensor histidine kinase [Acidimicrobiales bacterium]|nr:HAMP domain-containing sensor histidine kinase [Acidimicrobiales bacterium]